MLLDELAADAKPQPGTPLPLPLSVPRLVKGLKDPLYIVRRNARARIGNGHQNDGPLGRRFDADAALFGEPGGVTDQIEDDLSDPRRITEYSHAVGYLQIKGQALFLKEWSHHLGALAQ